MGAKDQRNHVGPKKLSWAVPDCTMAESDLLPTGWVKTLQMFVCHNLFVFFLFCRKKGRGEGGKEIEQTDRNTERKRRR